LTLDPAVLGSIRGNASRRAQLATNAAREILGVSTSDWLGPLQPLIPFAPEGTGVRTWDYPVGVNIRYQPRREGDQTLLGFDELRFFSRNVDLVRIIIENRKQQLARQTWQFKIKGDEDDGSETEDPRIDMLNKFFETPDPVGGVDFPTWMNLVVEDMLCIDAPCVYIQRDQSGKPIAIRHMDGATIKPLIDVDGSTPQPPSPAYQQIIHGVPIADLDRAQLFYYPRNQRPDFLYGYSQVETIVNTLNLILRREMHRIQFYTEANIPVGLLEAPEGLTKDQVADLQLWMNAALKGNTADRWNLLWTPNGTKYTDIKPPPLQDSLDEWFAQIVCYAFGVPPTPFMIMRAMARANAQTAKDQSNEEGLAPLIAWWSAFVTRLVTWGWGWDDIIFGPVLAQEQDPQIQANIHKTYLSLGVININEVREDLGRDPIEGGDEYRIYEATGPIPVSNADDLANAQLQSAQAGAQGAQAAAKAPQSGNAPDGSTATKNPPPNAASGGKAVARVGTRGSSAQQNGNGNGKASKVIDLSDVRKKKASTTRSISLDQSFIKRHSALRIL
jgi:hypothetical protein